MAIKYRIATCLDTLLTQLNSKAPRRSKASDGAIGDDAHASRDSDHNAWVVLRGTNWVTARDFTHDPGGGLDCGWLAEVLVKSRDPRIKYLIWRDKFWTRAHGWRDYVKVNPRRTNKHISHLHISVQPSEASLTATLWVLGGTPQPGPARPTQPAPQARRLLKEGMTGTDIWVLQEFLNRVFPDYTDTPIPKTSPPRFGPQTKRAVQEFQRRSKLTPDGIVGLNTWAGLVRAGLR